MKLCINMYIYKINKINNIKGIVHPCATKGWTQSHMMEEIDLLPGHFIILLALLDFDYVFTSFHFISFHFPEILNAQHHFISFLFTSFHIISLQSTWHHTISFHFHFLSFQYSWHHSILFHFIWFPYNVGIQERLFSAAAVKQDKQHEKTTLQIKGIYRR